MTSDPDAWRKRFSAARWGNTNNVKPPVEEQQRNWTPPQSWQRKSEPGASRWYYLALRDTPRLLEVWMTVMEGRLTVRCFPKVVAHQAEGQLTGRRGLGGLSGEEGFDW